MSHRVTFVLAVALMAAGLFAWFDLQPGEGAPSTLGKRPIGSTVDASSPLLEFALEEVEEIHIQYRALKLQTRRDNGGWSGVSRPERVDSFLDTLAEMVQIMALQASAEDPSIFGLEPPTGRIDLRLRDAPPIHLLLGGPNPAGTANYARIGSTGPVVLTGALLRWELDKLSRAFTE